MPGRAAAAAAIALAAVAAAGAAPARADAWQLGVEAGAEYDTNVHRVEVDPEGTRRPVAAALTRAGARLDGAGARGAWGRWAATGQALIRRVAGDERGEDVGVVAADARWERALGDRRAQVAARASYYDAIPLGEPGGARTFALGGADAIVAVVGDAGDRFAASVGARDFRYKPDPAFDWQGVALAARYARTVWRRAAPDADADALDGAEAGALAAADEASLELAVGYRLERRGYRGVAFTSGCAPGEPVTPACFVPTAIPRGDLHHVATVELAYTGDVVATAGYQAIVNDSSSYGQSLVRHRVAASATVALPGGVFATAAAAVQLDVYLDPLLLARDVTNQSFTSIDEENRSAVSARLSRGLGGGWAAEARWAFYADSLSGDDLAFRRHVVYAGVLWNRR